MTTEAIKGFARRLSDDKALAARLDERLKDVPDGDPITVETAAFARASGFDVTEDEVTQLIAAARASLDGEISEGELEIVAGGICPCWFRGK